MPYIHISHDRHVHYQVLPGDTKKPCLVFLHDGLGCGLSWSTIPEVVCRKTGCPGLVYDRSGHGKSSSLSHRRTIHYLHEYALVELPLLLQTVIPDTPLILIGHSDGGSISLIYGAERSPLLKGIITEAPHVFVEDVSIAGIKKAEDAWQQGKLTGLSKYHGEKTEHIFKAWSETWLSKWFKSWNIEYLLPSIEVPMLIIQGRDDQYGSENQVHAIAQGAGGSVHTEIIDNCSHAPHLEAQEETVDIMCTFIARIIRVQQTPAAG